MKFSIIAAFEVNTYGIGYDGGIPWSIPDDMKHFRHVTTLVPSHETTNNVVIMGRKTWESLQSIPLKNRINIVITSKKIILPQYSCNKFTINHPFACSSLSEALSVCKAHANTINEVFVIGGQRLYEEALMNSLFSNAYLTQIYMKDHHNAKFDAFFPFNELLHQNFNCISTSVMHKYNNFTYSFLIFERKNTLTKSPQFYFQRNFVYCQGSPLSINNNQHIN